MNRLNKKLSAFFKVGVILIFAVFGVISFSPREVNADSFYSIVGVSKNL